MPIKLQLTYYPWITQSISGGQLAAAIGAFAQILEADLVARLGEALTIDVLPEMDVSDQVAHVKATPPQGSNGTIALMNPLGYAVAHASEGMVTAAAVVRRRISGSAPGPTYRAQIYVNALTGITSLDGLRKRSFAFGSPQSTSNFLMPAHMLWSNGIHPLHAFGRLEFSGGHDFVAKAVYEGRVDAGAGHDGVIIDLATKPGFSNAGERLTRLAWSPDIPSDPVAAHVPDSAMLTEVIASLVEIAPATNQNAPGNQAIKVFWGTAEGLEAIDARAYEPLLKVAADLGLRPEDMLRKS